MAADDEKANTARRRSSLRLLCELYLVGLHHYCLGILEIIRLGTPAVLLPFSTFFCDAQHQRYPPPRLRLPQLAVVFLMHPCLGSEFCVKAHFSVGVFSFCGLGTWPSTEATSVCRRGLAAADHVRDPTGGQAALSLSSTFAKEYRVDFLGLVLLPPSQQNDNANKVHLR